jgi:formylglycine-generating enzyme required for sulfatase activity/predicted Ser/Thr protein kinase
MSGSQPADDSDKRSSGEQSAFQSQGELPTRLNVGSPGVSSSMAAFQKVLPERYQLVREIGQGGMGQVLLAIDRGPTLKDQEYVAIKRMLGPVLSDSKAVDKFLAEVKLARKLRHPNVVKMYHSENTPLGPYIVMEYIDGVDLGEYIQRHGPLSEKQALAYFRKLAAALDDGHKQGIIHRDLKPRNILISKSEEPFLVDFGIARRLSDSDKTGIGMGAGTLAYMSPEQLENRKPDAKQDIYSLGATLFHVVEGRPPFDSDSIPRLIAKIMSESAPKATKVSAQLAERIAQCLEKEPRLRPVSCQAVCKLSPPKDTTPPPAGKGDTTSDSRVQGDRVVVPPVIQSPPQRVETSKPISRSAPNRRWKTSVTLAAGVMLMLVIGLAVWQPWNGAATKYNAKAEQVIGIPSGGADQSPDIPNHPDNTDASESEVPQTEKSVANHGKSDVSINVPPKVTLASLPQSFTNSIGMELRLIQPGNFLMGSPSVGTGSGRDETPHEVTISSPFYLGVYEVTQEQYEKVMESNPSGFKGPGHPVDTVRWEDAQEFIRRMNAMSAEQAAGRKYRLPTEAEWEYACRAGTKTAYSFGDDSSELSRYGWSEGNSAGKSQPVGEKRPNPWGLYDMHGNVWEWCEDWYGVYPTDAMLDPTGSDTGSERVLRSGSWLYPAAHCQSARRYSCKPSGRTDYGDHGFRVALSPAGIPAQPAAVLAVSDSSENKPASNSGNAPIEKPMPSPAVPNPAPTDSSASPTVKQSLPLSLTNSIGMEFRLIPSGTFLMGSPAAEADRWTDETQHEVTISRPYYLGVYEVTQQQYSELMSAAPSFFYGQSYPVESVSWEDAQEFIRRLNAAPEEQAAGRKYRLPTEAEWEYACRAGSRSAYCFGDDSKELQKYGWFVDNSSGRTQPPGEKKANAWGLFDMHGNVWEWCEDWYGTYSTDAMTDPTGPSTGSRRVCRGGSWDRPSDICRSAIRGRNIPTERLANFIGFRVYLTSVGIPLQATAMPTVSGKSENKAAASSDIAALEKPTSSPTVSGAPPANSTTSTAINPSLAQPLINSIGMEFRLIQPGTFLMGSPAAEAGRATDETQHEVTISNPFYLGVYEVTQEQYGELMERNVSLFKNPRNPVENVAWLDAKEFISRLNELPAEQAAGRKYRLPTEAEWEYACRAGTTTAYSFGDDASLLSSYAWFADNSSSATHPVGEKKPNAWGLFDMHGNVWEWCEDWHGEYPANAAVDPTGPTQGDYRVLRGGSWVYLAAGCRSADRRRDSTWNREEGRRGFRVALIPPENGK